MRSNLSNISEMASETRERALHHAMSIEIAGKANDRPGLWFTTANLAMDAQGAALMTINSALIQTCPEYREEHERTGYIDIAEDEPGSALKNHRCPQCQTLQELASVIRFTLGSIWGKTTDDLPATPERLQEVRDLHNLLLGQVHMAAGLAPKHLRDEG